MLRFYVLRCLYHRAENTSVNDEYLAAFGPRSRKTVQVASRCSICEWSVILYGNKDWKSLSGA